MRRPLDPRARRLYQRLRLELEVPQREIGQLLESAKAQLAEELAHDPTPGTTISALALGDFQSAPALARSIGPAQRGDGTFPQISSEEFIRLHTRYLAWTGSLLLIRTEWPRILQAFTAVEEGIDSLEQRERARWQALTEELGDAATSIGAPPPRSRLEGVSQPTPDPSLRPLGELPEDPDELVELLIHHILGISPDAPKDRLSIRPTLPDDWSELNLRSLHFGDAEVALRYERRGEYHTFEIAQESGAMPITLIFEPRLPGTRLVRVQVDGRAATLDPYPVDGSIAVPIQLILDEERVVEFEVSKGLGRTGIRLPVR